MPPTSNVVQSPQPHLIPKVPGLNELQLAVDSGDLPEIVGGTQKLINLATKSMGNRAVSRIWDCVTRAFGRENRRAPRRLGLRASRVDMLNTGLKVLTCNLSSSNILRADWA